MIKLFIGGKGSGKTKTLIELVNNATEASKGSVVCIEKGDKLKHKRCSADYPDKAARQGGKRLEF